VERAEPLRHNVAIADPNGTPTPHFIRQWQALLGMARSDGSLTLLRQLLNETLEEREVSRLELGFGLAAVKSAHKRADAVMHLESQSLTLEPVGGVATPDFRRAWVNRLSVGGSLHIAPPITEVANRTVLLRLDVQSTEVALTWDAAYLWPEGMAPEVAQHIGARHYVSMWLDEDGYVAAVMPPEFLAEPR